MSELDWYHLNLWKREDEKQAIKERKERIKKERALEKQAALEEQKRIKAEKKARNDERKKI